MGAERASRPDQNQRQMRWTDGSASVARNLGNVMRLICMQMQRTGVRSHVNASADHAYDHHQISRDQPGFARTYEHPGYTSRRTCTGRGTAPRRFRCLGALSPRILQPFLCRSELSRRPGRNGECQFLKFKKRSFRRKSEHRSNHRSRRTPPPPTTVVYNNYRMRRMRPKA